MSIREQCLAEQKTLLNTGTPGGVPQTKRGYLFAVNADTLPEIRQFVEHDDAEVISAHNMPAITRHTMSVGFQVFVKSTATDSPDMVAEPLLNWIVKQLSGRRATGNTGPYIMMFEDKTEWDYSQMEHGFAKVTLYIGVKYQHKVDDPDTWA